MAAAGATTLGRSLYLIGSNRQATRFSGVNTARVQIAVYILSALLGWGAALLMMAKFSSAKAGYGRSYLLVTILASVLGGINPDGGFGRILGLVLALIVLQMLESGLNLLGVSSYLIMALWGRRADPVYRVTESKSLGCAPSLNVAPTQTKIPLSRRKVQNIAGLCPNLTTKKSGFWGASSGWGHLSAQHRYSPLIWAHQTSRLTPCFALK